MMLGLDVKLVVSKVKKTDRAEIKRICPNAFKPISISWYGYGATIIRGSIPVKTPNVDGWVRVPITIAQVKKIDQRFYKTVGITKVPTRIQDQFGGDSLWSSMDVLSHFGDIVFACYILTQRKYKVSIEYKEC
jgi:hypothetical protein